MSGCILWGRSLTVWMWARSGATSGADPVILDLDGSPHSLALSTARRRRPWPWGSDGGSRRSTVGTR